MTYIAKNDVNYQENRHRPLCEAASSEFNFLYPLMNAVIRSQWREVDLDFSFRETLHFCQKSIAFGPFPSIERLSLTAPEDCCTRIQSHLDLSKSHQLKNQGALLRGDWDVYHSLPSCLDDFRPALPSLATLEFERVGDMEVYSSFVRLIRNAQNLHTLTIRTMSGRMSFPYPKQRPRLKNIRKLRVVVAAGQSAKIACYLACIKFPMLQQLVVQTL